MKYMITALIFFSCLIGKSQRILIDDPHIYCYLDSVRNVVQCQSYYRGSYYVNIRQGYKFAYGMDLRICFGARFTFTYAPSVIEIRHKRKVTRKSKYRFIYIK